MSEIVSNILRKVFAKNEANLISWLERKKSFLLLILVAGVIIWAYTRWPQVFDFLRLEWLLLVWLLILTFYVFRKERAVNEKEFKDDFRHGLSSWQYFGDWKTEKIESSYILTVTNSSDGGIVTQCSSWIDYIFEFETKIIRHNSSWLIRARDIFNYVMLQCQPTQLIPHLRVNGHWVKLDPIPLTENLPLNSWFQVQITIKGTRVIVKVRVNEIEREILNDETLLETKKINVELPKDDGQFQTQEMMVSYPMGSVGFRESRSSKECAHFRNIQVRRI